MYSMERKYLTVKEAATYLGVSALTLRNWDKRKKLIAYRHPINNYRVYKLADIQDFLTNIENINKPKKIHIDFLNDDLPEPPNDVPEGDGELRI